MRTPLISPQAIANQLEELIKDMKLDIEFAKPRRVIDVDAVEGYLDELESLYRFVNRSISKCEKCEYLDSVLGCRLEQEAFDCEVSK